MGMTKMANGRTLELPRWRWGEARDGIEWNARRRDKREGREGEKEEEEEEEIERVVGLDVQISKGMYGSSRNKTERKYYSLTHIYTKQTIHPTKSTIQVMRNLRSTIIPAKARKSKFKFSSCT